MKEIIENIIFLTPITCKRTMNINIKEIIENIVFLIILTTITWFALIIV
jgi:hypothetical protein